MDDLEFMTINGVPECVAQDWLKQRADTISGIGRVASLDYTKLGVLGGLITCGYFQINSPDAMPRHIAQLVVQSILRDAKIDFVSKTRHDELLVTLKDVKGA